MFLGSEGCEHEWRDKRYYTERSAGASGDEAFSVAGVENAERIKSSRWRSDSACEKCGATDFTKETDILDVWFDSGSSSIAVLENRKNLHWPADVYIEGGDQFRGWFNSSLMVGLAVHDRAPYETVLTHGWTLDAQGKAMHKSLGNAVSPDEVIPKLGAEIIRLWCVSSDYMDDCATPRGSP